MACWHWLGVGVFTYKVARCFYFAAFALGSVLTWVFRERGASFSRVKSMRPCLTTGNEDDINQCFAKEAVLRYAVSRMYVFWTDLCIQQGEVRFDNSAKSVDTTSGWLMYSRLAD